MSVRTHGHCHRQSLYALLAGTVGQWLKGTRSFMRVERYLVGTVYIGLGVMAALADTKRH